jgi:hypothetical protein
MASNCLSRTGIRNLGISNRWGEALAHLAEEADPLQCRHAPKPSTAEQPRSPTSLPGRADKALEKAQAMLKDEGWRR